MTKPYRHQPVLQTECLDYLDPQPGQTYVDATLGFAGHALPVAQRLGKNGTFIGIDQDEQALAAACERLEAIEAPSRPELILLHGNFAELDDLLLSALVPGIDGILFDLGVSSYQIDEPTRGFSFREIGPLDMRMNPGKQTLTAAEILNHYNASDLTRIIRTYGEERWASRITHFIVEARGRKPLETTEELVAVIDAAIPMAARKGPGHPARRTFQALRIAVNAELDSLTVGLESAIRWLNPGGVLAVISYHSLEDRIVKSTFSDWMDRCICPPDLPVCACGRKPLIDGITRKPITPTSDEVDRNPRSRSAKLRVAHKRGLNA